MKRGAAGRILAACAALLTAQAHAHDSKLDLKRLPLGDTRLSQGPKAGWIWACRVEAPNFQPNLPPGPWIKSDGTYDLTAKAAIGGSETWPHRFMMSETATARVFSTNDLPQHPTGTFPIKRTDPAYPYDRNPNRILEQDMRVELPLNPMMAPQPSCAPGAVGILLSGVVLFSALDAVGRDAVAHEVQDKCQGHPQISGTYHYHSLTDCMDDKRAPGGHSALLGYALDGFGIYGRYGEGGKELASADLDACHGHVHKIDWNGKAVEMYHYHGSYDFPYTIGCMRGTVDFRNVAIVSGGPARMPPRLGPGQQQGGPQQGGPPRQPPGGAPPPPDLNAAAARLGIPVQKLMGALGSPPPDLAAAAAKLGISQETLFKALRPEGLPSR